MSKRSAVAELNHDNWNADDEKEEPGTFQRVDESEMKNRIIKKAKRSLNRSDSSGNNTFSGASPFAAFSGFSSSASSFSLLKKPDNANSGRSPLHAETSQVTKIENGKSLDNQEKNAEDKIKENQKSLSNTNTSKPSSRSIEYYRQLQSLNESILKWMQMHVAKNSCCDFTPVFNDYKKHMDTLNFTYPIKKKDGVLALEDKNTGRVMGAATTEDAGSSMDSNYSNPTVSASKTEKGDETDYGSNFSARTTNTSSFSFGMKLTPTATSSVSPMGPTSSSKEEEKAPEKQGFSFKFDVKNSLKDSTPSTGFSFASAIAARSAETENKEEENYEPPKNEFVAVSEEDALYSKRCKLFFKKDDGYADKGVGTLYLKSLKDKTQLLIRADTNLGNILLNIMLSASLPMSRTGKNNVLLVCVPNPPIDAKNADSKEAIPMLIRVKTSEDADELLDVLNKHKS